MTTFERRVLDSPLACLDGPEVRGVDVRAHLAALIQAEEAAVQIALDAPDPAELIPRLDAVEARLRGFCYESAGMMAMARDLMDGGEPRRTRALLPQVPPGFEINAHVGVGMAFSRTGLPLISLDGVVHPLFGVAVYDGLGFMEGLRRPRPLLLGRRGLRQVKGDPYAQEQAHRGMGRSLWYLTRAHAPTLGPIIRAFDAAMADALWRGVGVAAAYSGGNPPEELPSLKGEAGVHLAALASGIALGAFVRRGNGDIGPHTERVCQAIWGADGAAVAELCAGLMPHPGEGEGRSANREWDAALRAAWAGHGPRP